MSVLATGVVSNSNEASVFIRCADGVDCSKNVCSGVAEIDGHEVSFGESIVILNEYDGKVNERGLKIGR